MTTLALILAAVALALLFPTPIIERACRKHAEHYIDGRRLSLWAQPWWLRVLLRYPAATTFSRDCITINTQYWDNLDGLAREILIRHELVHCAQAERLGILYLPTYLILLIRHGYNNHPWEVEANAKENG